MDVKNQKNLAARVFGVGKKRIRFNPLKLDEIKKAITREDIRKLTDVKVEPWEKRPIEILPKKGVSRARARHRELQRKKGRQKGHGSRKGTFKTRIKAKATWIAKIRLLRKILRESRAKKEITSKEYRKLYMLAKGNFFRSKKHLQEYILNIKNTRK